VAVSARGQDMPSRHCQFSCPWYARWVGGASARVGRFFAHLSCRPALTERGSKRRPGSAKLTMPREGLAEAHFWRIARLP
jgi:hypothetical protein